MIIIAIETTGKHASVAWIDGQGDVREAVSPETLNHLSGLVPMLAALLDESGLTPDKITHVAASVGPGSFTGIRIGVATARALAQALDVPTFGVPTLKAFAYNAPQAKALLCPIFDARRNQVYGGGFRWRPDGEIAEVIAPGAYELDAFLACVRQQAAGQNGEEDVRGGLAMPESSRGDVLFFGDGIEKYKAEIEQWQHASSTADIRIEWAPEEDRTQRAASVAKLALALYRRGEVRGFEALTPFYARQAEAERKRLTIRRAGAADVKAIAALEKICFIDPWSERSIEEELTQNTRAAYLVAVVDAQVVGYAGFWNVADEGHITNVATGPEHRRKGIAAALVGELLELAAREGIAACTLEVRAGNEAALALYRKFGFETQGIRKKYYQSNDEDAVIMWKQLAQAAAVSPSPEETHLCAEKAARHG